MVLIRMIRPRKIHGRACGPMGTTWAAVCGRPNAVIGDNVNCHVCLYHLGRYVPLVKLREHQRLQHFEAWIRGPV